MSRVFANGPGDQRSIPGRVIPKTLKMVLDLALLSTQHYKVRIKGCGAIQGMEWRPPLHLVVVAIEKGTFGSPSTKVANFTLLYICVYNCVCVYIYVCVCVCVRVCVRVCVWTLWDFEANIIRLDSCCNT